VKAPLRHPTFVEFVQTRCGVRLHRGQRVLMMVAADGVEPGLLTGKDRAVARELFGDIDVIPTEARSVLVAVIGARSGKSYISALYSLWRALIADLTSLAPGERASALILAPTMALARQTLRFALGAAEHVPAIARMIVSRGEDAFVIRRDDGALVAIECAAASLGGAAGRGRTLVCAALDEAGFFRDAAYVYNAPAVFTAVAPRVIAGGLTIVASTPWGEGGLLFELFTANHGKPVTALAAHAPTTLMRDDARTLALVAREYLRDHENAEREFGARFMLSGAGLFFEGPTLKASAKPLEVLTSAPAGVRVGAGADLALIRDASAIAIVHRYGTDAAPRFRIAEALELKPTKGTPLDLSRVMGEFASIAGRHHAAELMADHHLLPVANTMLPAGVRLVAMPAGQGGKLQVYGRVRDLFRAGLIDMPESMHAVREQLSQISSTPTSGGGVAIRSPRRAGTHGDLGAALVLAIYAAAVGTSWQPVDWDFIDQCEAVLPQPFSFGGPAGTVW
jgi:hypothetical protein